MIMYFHYLISKIEKNPEISSRCISYNTMQVLKAKSSFLAFWELSSWISYNIYVIGFMYGGGGGDKVSAT